MFVRPNSPGFRDLNRLNQWYRCGGFTSHFPVSFCAGERGCRYHLSRRRKKTNAKIVFNLFWFKFSTCHRSTRVSVCSCFFLPHLFILYRCIFINFLFYYFSSSSISFFVFIYYPSSSHLLKKFIHHFSCRYRIHTTCSYDNICPL